MTVSKEQVYDLIKQLSEEECYIGLHGIADKADIINEFSNLPKNEKAKKILEIGLKNARGETISHTVRNFGTLENIDSSDIENINGYGFYSPSGEEAIVVVSIPLFFEDSSGRKIFGGYKERGNSDKERAECITDYIFKDNIPPEMILGYYTYNMNSNNVEFIENPKYYSRLSQSEKDSFINKYFNNFNAFDVNNEATIERIKEFANDWENMPYLKKTVEQYEQRLAKKNNYNIETHPLDYPKELCQRMDEVLNECQHVSDIREDALDYIRNAAKNDSEYLEWLYYKKYSLLKERNEFQNIPYILDNPHLPFDCQLETNAFSYGENDDVFNSMIVLPIYTMPQISGKLEENFRLKYFQKMLLGNNSCIVVEKSISNSELENIKQAILEKIHNKEMELNRKLTDEEKNNIISNVASIYGMENITSFDFSNGLLIPDWQKYSKEQNIPNVNIDGSSLWQLNSMQIIDNRAKTDGKVHTLEKQLETTRINNNDITNSKSEEETEIKETGPLDELLDLSKVENMLDNGNLSEAVGLLFRENLRLRRILKEKTVTDEKNNELSNPNSQESKIAEKNYSLEELDSTKLSNIDMSLVKPDYDIILHSKKSKDLGIADILSYRIGRALGLNDIPLDKTSYNYLLEKMKQQGKTKEQIDALSKEYYFENKKEFDDMFLSELSLSSFSARMNELAETQYENKRLA